MASHRLTTDADAPDTALAAYLDRLAARLRGPRRRRDAILAELRDGLDHATDDHIAAGLTTRPGRRRPRSPSSARRKRSPTRSPANWPPPTPGAPSPATSPPAPRSGSGGCCCCTPARGAPA